MRNIVMNRKLIMFCFSSLCFISTAFAATEIDLRYQPVRASQPLSPQILVALPSHQKTSQSGFRVIRTEVDFNHTKHTHLQQTYAGFPVLNAIAVVHTTQNNKETRNGVIYESLDRDLGNISADISSDAQKSAALKQAKITYEKQTALKEINYQQEKVDVVIAVDANNIARAAYRVSFFIDDGISGVHRPTIIMDAKTFSIYRQWDGVQTDDPLTLNNAEKSVSPENKIDSATPTDTTSDGSETKQEPPKDPFVLAGGIGGNKKIGEIFYDGAIGVGHLPTLRLVSDGHDEVTFKNDQNTPDLEIQDVSYDRVLTTQCSLWQEDAKQNYCWLVDLDYWGIRDPFGWAHWQEDEVNGGYSPSIDAYYAGSVVRQLFQEWYGIPALVNEDHKTTMKLVMRVHYGRNYENATWDGKEINIGDGGKRFYPLTSLDVLAHEIGHGFTQQHSGLGLAITSSMPESAEDSLERGEALRLQSAVNESFSDMTSMAAQFYVSGKNDWTIGRSVTKSEGVLRYLDDPTKDGISIDNVEEYENNKKYTFIDAHWGSGILNKAFYLIATSPGWDTHKAYNIMVKANMDYWTSSMKSFTEAGCGIVSAAADYQYNLADVRVALAAVGIDTSRCGA